MEITASLTAEEMSAAVYEWLVKRRPLTARAIDLAQEEASAACAMRLYSDAVGGPLRCVFGPGDRPALRIPAPAKVGPAWSRAPDNEDA